jgi:transposase
MHKLNFINLDNVNNIYSFNKIKLMQQQVIKNSFIGQELQIGIDVHKLSWKVTIACSGQKLKQMSMNPNSDELIRFLKTHYPLASYRAVYEAGFSGFTACRELIKGGVDCIVVHAADVPTTHKEKMQKTDSIDSFKLAKALGNNEFKGIHIPDRELEIDRALIRQRERITKDIVRIKLRLGALLFQFNISIPDRFTKTQIRSWTKAYTSWLLNIEGLEPSLNQIITNYVNLGMQLRKELLIVIKQIRSLGFSKYKSDLELIRTIPGVGFMTGIYFLVQLGDIKRFGNNDELNSYIGLIPKMHSSGPKTRASKLTNRGRKEMKIDLIEASWISIKKDPELKQTFERFCQTMTKNKAIIRIARRLASRIKCVLANKKEYKIAIQE